MITQSPLLRTTKAYGQLLGRDLNPLAFVLLLRTLVLSHNIGMSIFNGLSPMAMEKLAEHGVLAAPIILMCIAASITLFGSLKIPCHYRVPLDVIEQADTGVKGMKWA